MLAAWAAGCTGPEDKAPVDTADSAAPDTDTTGVREACPSVGWDSLVARDVIWVSGAGSDAGAGTLADPVATVPAALTLARAASLDTIAIGAGTFAATLELDAGDSGLLMVGCGRGETFLQPESEEGFVVRADGVSDLLLRDLDVTGGERTLWIWKGGSTTVSRIGLSGATGAAIVVDGSFAVPEVTFEDVEIDTVLGSETFSGLGVGIAVQSANISMAGGGIRAATGVGVLVTGVGATLALDSVYVDDTQLADGAYGRGLQVQELGAASLSNGTSFSRNLDAAVFATGFSGFTADDVFVSGTGAGVAGDGGATGDGIVIAQGGAGDVDPAFYPARLGTVTSTDNARAAVLADGVTLTSASATFSGNAPGFDAIALQGGAVLVGADPSVSVEDTPLSLRTDLLLSTWTE